MIRTVVNSLLPFPIIPRPGILFGSKWKREEVAKLLANNQIIQYASSIRNPQPPVQFAMDLLTGIPKNLTDFNRSAKLVHSCQPKIVDLISDIHEKAYTLQPNFLLELAGSLRILSSLPPTGEYVEKAKERGLVPYTKLVIAAIEAMNSEKICFIERGITTLKERGGDREAYDAIFTLGDNDLIFRNGMPIAFNANGIGKTHSFWGNFSYDPWGRTPISFPNKEERLLV